MSNSIFGSEAKLFYGFVSVAILAPGIIGLFEVDRNYLSNSIIMMLQTFVIALPLVAVFRKIIGVLDRESRVRLSVTVCILTIIVHAVVNLIGYPLSTQSVFETFAVYIPLAGVPCTLSLLAGTMLYPAVCMSELFTFCNDLLKCDCNQMYSHVRDVETCQFAQRNMMLAYCTTGNLSASNPITWIRWGPRVEQ